MRVTKVNLISLLIDYIKLRLIYFEAFINSNCDRNLNESLKDL